MGIVSGKQLTEALQKAQAVGMVEESFKIGDCEVTLRNLRPDQYEGVIQECKDLEDVAYLNKWQEGHVCRSIVQINGVDLRDADFVEVEEPDPKNKGQVKTVKRELHDWLRRHVLSTWAKEAIYTTFRKFTDVIILAESSAKKDVKFVVAEETPEDQFRRLLGELKELESEVPPPLVRAALEEHGYTHFTQPQDVEALRNFDQNVPKPPAPETPPSAAPAPPPPAAPTSPPPPAAPPIAATPQASAIDPALRAAQIMRTRVPLNQQPVSVPDISQAPAAEAPVTYQPIPHHRVPSGADIGLPEGGISPSFNDERASAPVPVIPPGMMPPSNMPPGMAIPAPPPGSTPVPMLDQRGAHATDPRQLATIVNQPPHVGLNPKYRPHGQ